MRKDNRGNDQLRKIEIENNYLEHAPGSVLIKYGKTHVICTASITDSVPRFLKGTKKGWLTAEYGMLPLATQTRTVRESARGKQNGRTQEIQRLIGRCLRKAIDLSLIGEQTINIDCDVIQADGGTRTAAITGGCVALFSLIENLQKTKAIKKPPFTNIIAAVSVGIVNGVPMLDLNYEEDSAADTDMNIIKTDSGKFIEIQGTAKKLLF